MILLPEESGTEAPQFTDYDLNGLSEVDIPQLRLHLKLAQNRIVQLERELLMSKPPF